MESAKWQNIKNIFSAVVDLSEQNRFNFLAGEADEIRLEVNKLLLAHEKAADFIDKPILVEEEIVKDETEDNFVGSKISNYSIIERIGTGGMGAVYLAERQNSDFTQKAALKIIKRGMDSEEILRRFAIERRILSTLKHPNIAQLLDGGISKEGIPFFVMEYVEGEPLNRFCREHHYSLNERLEIFRQICSAVEHAHKNLIVHRDIKPSNILLTKEGIPKLLDFGIAKLLSDENSEITLTQAKILTPEYASPEQFLGKNITTATDIYSLGVILYELLSGHRPFETKGKSLEEIIVNICETEPTRPSEAATFFKAAITTNLPEKPRSISGNSQSLRGDLDNIILKALRKEPSERYGSVQQFSEDILRYLQGLPVLARPQTLKYRFGKYFKRHKAGVFAAAFILLSLIGGISATTWQAFVAKHERERAERQFAATRKIANSLLFEIHDSLSDLPGATASRELLVKRALEYLNNLSLEAHDNPELLLELSIAYRKVGDIQGDPFMANTGNSSAAAESYQKSLEIQEKLLTDAPKDVNLQRQIRLTASQLGDNTYSLGNYLEAEKAYQRAVKAAIFLVEKEPDNLGFNNNLAFLYQRLSWLAIDTHDFSERLNYFELAQKYNDKALSINPEDNYALGNAIEIYSNIGNNLGNPDFNDAGKPEEALPYLQESLAMRQKIAAQNPNSNISQNSLGVGFKDLGDILLELGKTDEAIENYEKALKIHRTLAEKDLKNSLAQGIVGFDLTKLGKAFLRKGEIEKSSVNINEAIKILEKLHLADRANVMVAHTLTIALENLADNLAAKKEFAEAISLYERSLKIEEEINSRQGSVEFQMKIAQINFKIGNIKTFLPDKCRESRDAFEKSIEIFNKAREKSPLSPSNLNILRQAESKKLIC